ncbi:MAG: bifunctional DNA primase/polymerase, partial [Acidimicrobiales bacterium]
MAGSALQAAVGYAARGWAVFPLHSIRAGNCSCRRQECAHPAKHPLTRHGLHDATPDPAVIRAWWGRWPWANAGIVTGAVSGLVVLDIDPASHGNESLARLQSLMGSLPVTLTAETGGDGQHLFFTHPGGEVRNTT